MSRSSTKLLLVVNDAGFFLSHRLNLAREGIRRGWEVHVATPASETWKLPSCRDIYFHNFTINRKSMSPASEIRSVLSLYRIVRDVEPDLMHAVTIKPVLYAGLVASMAAKPAVVFAVSGLGHVYIAQGILAGLRRRLVNLLYRLTFSYRPSRVIFQNPDDRALLKDTVREGQSTIVPGSGVDPGEFSVTPEEEDPPIVVLASRLLWAKGVGEFVGAARILASKNVGARFVLVGDTDEGNPAAVPVTQIQDWLNQELVEWWGKSDNMARVFSRAAIVCLPSYREGLPRVLIEAAAAAKPIVATDVPGCRQIVHDGFNGILVPPRQSQPLASALEKLIADRSLRAKMGQSGRVLFLSRYTSDQIVKLTYSVYEQLLAERSATRTVA